MVAFIFAVLVFERILRRVAQLMNGGADAFAKFDIELHRPHAVFVRIHELLPKKSKFSSAPPVGQFLVAVDAKEGPLLGCCYEDTSLVPRYA